MNLREASHLAKIQGTYMELEARINCPYCDTEKKSLVLKLRHDSAYCFNCRKKFAKPDMNSLKMMIQDQALEDRSKMKEQMEKQPGY